mgnify:CR=1 FL=1
MTQDDLRISGYASRFGETDMSGDRVASGAFAGSLLALEAPRLPMLFGHQTDTPIGVWDRLYEDRNGLFVSGRIFAGSSLADRTMRLIREGAVSGLSIGYRTRRQIARTGGRTLTDIDLWEVSVVAFPMQRSARITQIGDIFSSTNADNQRSFA